MLAEIAAKVAQQKDALARAQEASRLAAAKAEEEKKDREHREAQKLARKKHEQEALAAVADIKAKTAAGDYQKAIDDANQAIKDFADTPSGRELPDLLAAAPGKLKGDSEAQAAKEAAEKERLATQAKHERFVKRRDEGIAAMKDKNYETAKTAFADALKEQADAETKKLLDQCVEKIEAAKIAASAPAETGNPEDDYQKTFGDEEKTVAKSGPKASAEFAAKLLTAAKSFDKQKRFCALLCNKAYEFGMKAPSGYQTAIDAMNFLLASGPDKDNRAAAQEKLSTLLRKCYTASAGDERWRLGKELVYFLQGCGDERAAARQNAEASTFYKSALTVAKAEKFWVLEYNVQEKMDQVTASIKSEQKLKDLKAKLEATPKNSVARTELIVCYLGEFDNPAEAAKLSTEDLDEKFRSQVPLAAKKLDALEEAACLDLARWYMTLAPKAAPAGKVVLLNKARACAEQYLALHTAEDADATAGKKLLGDIQKAIEKAGPKNPKTLTLDLGNKVTMKLVLIPAGKFIMGSSKAEQKQTGDIAKKAGDEGGLFTYEGPQHNVTISKPFYMGVYEVTQEQYEQVMGKNPSNFKGARNPVEQVSWDEADEFCRKLSRKTGREVHLPTEAQWEYAYRAGSTTRFYYGDDKDDVRLRDYAWYEVNSNGQTHPVGQKNPNDFGLYDMCGNVIEWCSDWYYNSYVSKADTTDPTGPTGPRRYMPGHVFRNGGYSSHCWNCRSTNRFVRDAGMNIGFRVRVEAK